MKRGSEGMERALLRPAQDGGSLPLDLTRTFGRAAPLAIEIGFGGGEALAWWATRRPEWNFLGFELPMECIARAAKTLARTEVQERVRLVRGDARHLLRELVPPASAVRALMQFPMPWPKQRHAKHRLTDSTFRDGLASALMPGGRFELVTDQQVFAEEMSAAFAPDVDFSLTPLEMDPTRAFRTRYERRWLAEGRHIWRMQATLLRNRSQLPLSNSDAMQAFSLAALPDLASLRALHGRRHSASGGQQVCEVRDSYVAEDGYLIQILAADEGFSQLFLVRVRTRASGGAILRLDECARPYPTPSVQAALLWLQSELGGESVR